VGHQSAEKPLQINELYKEADNNMYLDKLLKRQWSVYSGQSKAWRSCKTRRFL